MSNFSRDSLSNMLLADLRTLGREIGVKSPTSKKKEELIELIVAIKEGSISPAPPSKKGRPALKAKADFSSVLPAEDKVAAPDIMPIKEPQEEEKEQTQSFSSSDEQEISQFAPDANIFATGILEILPEGYGFLRVDNFNSSNQDVYVPPTQIKRFSLRAGDKLYCKARAFREKSLPSLIYIFTINDVPCEEYGRRERFEDMTSCYPSERISLEREKTEYSLRLIDLVAPVGKGQRGLIVAAPKTGKTILLKKIAQAVRANHPEINLTVLLIDERPEEVTDFKQSVDCEVAYSTFDQSPSHHVQTAELVLANAKRRVELGQDVMILLDSITRLGRAYNQLAVNSGRTMTGGLDISALQEPKRFFGAGRNVMGKGSLTILATALIDTGSKMDDIIYEEFKGTGNMEIHLDRKMSEKRIFPAIDLAKSGTRREEMLLTQSQLEGMWMIRRALSRTETIEATEQLLDILMSTGNNDEFINVLKVIAKKQKI